MSKYYTHSPLREFSCFDYKKIDRPWDRDQSKLTDLQFDDAWIKNLYGCIRWCFVRSAYWNGFIDLDRVIDIYREWRDSRENLWLDAYDFNNKFVETVFVKASKRGNDVYKDLMRYRFKFLDNLPQLEFFRDHDADKSTPMLFITVTVDPEKYSLNDAWLSIANETKIFDAKLRQEYGRFVKFRVWEAHGSGYPHSHIVYYFPNKKFKVFKHTSKKKKDGNGNPKITWRIQNKDRRAIGKMWNMGRDDPTINYGVDVQAVQDTKGALSEVKKYITKAVWNDKGDKTNAMVCLFNKQSYWISGIDPFRKVNIAIEKGIIDRSIDARSQYLSENMNKWLVKDFIGIIWGWKVYLESYKTRSGGLAEPTTTDLVSLTLCNYNKEKPEIAYFKFRGVFLHDNLKELLPEMNDSYEIPIKPPPEVRWYFGIDKPMISFTKSGSGRFVDVD